MSTTTRIGGATLAVTLLLALPIVGSAYEVTILDGRGAESKALNAGEYDDAIRRLEQKLEERRHHRGVLLTNLCTALVVTRDFEKAHTVCNEAVENEGDSVGIAYNSRGVLHALMGDIISAREDFSEAARKTNYPPGPIKEFPRGIFGAEDKTSDSLSEALAAADANGKAAEVIYYKMTAGPGYKPVEAEEDK